MENKHKKEDVWNEYLSEIRMIVGRHPDAFGEKAEARSEETKSIIIDVFTAVVRKTTMPIYGKKGALGFLGKNQVTGRVSLIRQNTDLGPICELTIKNKGWLGMRPVATLRYIGGQKAEEVYSPI